MFGEISAVTPIEELNLHGDVVPGPVPRASPATGGFVPDPSGGHPDTPAGRQLPILASAPAPIPHRRSARPAHPIGTLFYLASVGIVATATVGALFGIGLSLLAKPPDAVSTEVAIHSRGSDVRSLLHNIVPNFFGGTPVVDAKVVVVPVKSEILRPAALAALPDTPATPQPLAADQVPSPEQTVVKLPSTIANPSGSNTDDTAAEDETKPDRVRATAEDAAPPAVVAGDPATSAPNQAATAAPSSQPTVRPPVDVAELLARGNDYLGMGDVTSARLFYERAADAGSSQGAMRLGATFDPNFLGRAGLVGTRSDPARADMWYGRARDLGMAATAVEPHSRVTNEAKVSP
jgi:hypothetical protein